MPKKLAKQKTPTLYSLIIFSLLIAVFLAVLFGSTFFPSLLIKEVEKEGHTTIEALERTGAMLFESRLDNLTKESLIELKNIINNKAVLVVNQNGLVLSSLESADSLEKAIPFEPGFFDELRKKSQEDRNERPHLHKHFNYQGRVHAASYYFFERAEPDSPLILILLSELPRFYEARNRITFMVALTTALIAVAIVLFSVLLLRKHVIKPVKKLAGLVVRVGKGDFQPGPPIRAYGEIAELTGNFSLMVERLREIREKEKAVSRLKSEILSIAAHNLRTPLTALKWSLRAILDGEAGAVVSARQKELLEAAYKSNDNMIDLINDLLDVSRIEEGRFGYKWSYNTLERVVDAVMESSGSKIRKSGLQFIYHKPKTPLPKLKMDFQKIVTVVGNLFDNALKFTPQGKIEVFLSYKKNPPLVVFEIKDTGIGIPKSEQKKIFSKFFRASNVLASDIKGTGLGLFIVKEIIEKHKGKLWFESKEGEGSVFGFSLPVEEKFAPKEEYLEFLENI